jgi:hypothetical protein
MLMQLRDLAKNSQAKPAAAGGAYRLSVARRIAPFGVPLLEEAYAVVLNAFVSFLCI